MPSRPPRCERRSRITGGRCPASRLRTAWGRYAPACARHLSQAERARIGLAGGVFSLPDDFVDVAKLAAGDRD